MSESAILAENAIYWALLAAFVATYVWRGLGVALAGRLSPTNPWFEWVASVAYALIAALVARFILLPAGELATVPLPDRLIAFAGGIIIFLLARRSFLAGTFGGGLVFALIAFARSLLA